MKHLLYVVPGGVAIGSFSRQVLDAMTGDGGLIRPDQVDREVDKFVNPPEGQRRLSREVAEKYTEGIAFGGMTEAEAIQTICDKDKPVESTAVHVIEEAGIPADRTFRGAWEARAKTIQVNMPKARVIHMDKIRRVRNDELAKLDVPFMRAVESGDTAEQARIAASKKKLRDIPQAFSLDAFDTPEKLKAAVPPELTGKM